MEVSPIETLIDELEILNAKLENHCKANDYIYSSMFEGWVNQYNKIVDKINNQLKSSITKYQIEDWDYSSTGKTVKQTALDNLKSSIIKLVSRLENALKDVQSNNQKKETPPHQIRKCFKLNVPNCPVNPKLIKNKAFIGMPFRDEYLDSFNYGIKPALESIGYSYFKADESISNTDIMCKICSELQSSSIVIFNISGLNPNVMLELGLAYGVGKSVIIVKDKNTKAISDIGSIEYIEYDHAHDLMQKLSKGLPTLIKAQN